METGSQSYSLLNFLANPYIWGMMAAWFAGLFAADGYLRCAGKLCAILAAYNPLFWQQGAQYSRGSARRVEWLVLFNYASDQHPADPEFAKLLRSMRKYAGLSMVCFVIGIIFLGLADRNFSGR